MNKRQKAIVVEIIIVILITIIAVVVFLNVRDYFNRQEAKTAVMVLGNRIKSYRARRGLVPSESWVDEQRETLPGNVRLGELHYRGRWIDLESDPNEILAYTEKKARSLIFKDGYLVLRLKEVLGRETRDVNIEWMDTQDFETLLARQQSRIEIEMLSK